REGHPGPPLGSRGVVSGVACPRCLSAIDVSRIGPQCPSCGSAFKTFGRFVLLSELGRGGMGVVHAAWDGQLGRVVALKTLLPGKGVGRELVGRFQREAEALARLRHPNIVSIHDVGEAEGAHYLVMELVPGKTLEDRAGELGLTKGL